MGNQPLQLGDAFAQRILVSSGLKPGIMPLIDLHVALEDGWRYAAPFRKPALMPGSPVDEW
ncbi:hypothetical protein OK351_14800 [Glutamicibacter sp. MNS18]|uniref:hypothetical protein n=1 Tax=Glutamicibacter sp. MNS18 TaxID=2989817 RepID=UPI0022365923|nr:hypothetical protein [Glutamicibacter sp. MNS18]MCW4466760.1 hypothetical protein [Glutamicibacter sp. MNS18]